MEINGVYAGMAVRQEKYQSDVEQITLDSLSQPQAERSVEASPESPGEARVWPEVGAGSSPSDSVTLADIRTAVVPSQEEAAPTAPLTPTTPTTLSEPVYPDDVIREIAEADLEEGKHFQFVSVLKMNAAEWPYIIIGVLASVIMGMMVPAFSLIYGELFQLMSMEDFHEARIDNKKYSIALMSLGFVSCVSMLLQVMTLPFHVLFSRLMLTAVQGAMFGVSGESLTKKVRSRLFQSILRQELAWFEKEENNTGTLCATLSNEACKVQGATGIKVGSFLQGFSGILFAIAIALYYNLVLGAVAIAFLPALIAAAYLHMWIIVNTQGVERKIFEKASKLAVDAVTNIRTVASMRCEKSFLRMFQMELYQPHSEHLNKAHIR